MIVVYENQNSDRSFLLTSAQMDMIERLIRKELIGIKVECAMLIDTAGNIVLQTGSSRNRHTMDSLAALASANFAAVNAMARSVGEREFMLLFHQGKNASVQFSCVNQYLLLVTIFGQEVTLGVVRMKLEKVIRYVRAILKKT